MAVKVHKGLYPPGKGYAYSKSLGGWVKAGQGETKKGTGGPAGPKYVATPYKEREYTPKEATGQYRDEARLKQQAAAAEKVRKKEAAAERKRAAAQAKIWAVEQSILPGELSLFGKPKKPQVSPGSRPMSEWGKPAKTWQQTEAELKEARAKRLKLADALPFTSDRKRFVEGMTPERRHELSNRKLPQPAPKPWEPHLGPMASRIPFARQGAELGHFLGLGAEAAPTFKEAARTAWDVRNLTSEIGNTSFDWLAQAGKKYATGDTEGALKAFESIHDHSPDIIGALARDPKGKAKAVAEAGWAGIMGVNKAAEALSIAAQNQDWLTTVTPAQRARNEKEIRTVLNQGRGAEFGRDWVVGPALTNAMEGGPMTPMAWAELTMLLAPGVGFTPLKPVVAGTRAGIKGVRLLPKGGRHAWSSAVKEFNRIQPVPGLATSERGSVSVGMLGGVKPEPEWRAGYAKGFRGQAAKSQFGRIVERNIIDKVRAKTGRTVVHEGKEAAKRARIQRAISEAPYKRLEKAASKMDVDETYVIRALASGVHPLERQAWHLQQAEKADDVMGMYSHMVHADLNEGVAKFVEELPDGTIVLRDEAPQKLKDIWRYYQESYEKTEGIWRDMDVISAEAIEGRVQATGKIMKGGQYVDAETWAVLQLQHSQMRAEVVHEAFKLVDAGLASPEDVSLWMDVIDAQARALAMRETNRLRRRAVYYRKRIRATEDEDVVAEYMMRLEEVNNQLAEGVDPAGYYKDLLWIKTGPARNLWPELFGADYQRVSFFAALKHWSDEVVDKRLASKLDEKKFHNGLATNPTIKRSGYTVAGKTTPKAWLQRVTRLMPTQEEQAYWAEWYEDYAGAFAVFGADAEQVMRGFAASQANQAPAGGITSVLKVMDRLRKGEKITSEGIGMVAKAVSEAVQGSELEKGVAAKLSDFADALRGADTRTWMGNQPEGGAPAPADIWAARDLGYVDKKHAKRLTKVFGLKEGKDFIVDSPGAPSGLRYERIAEAYTEIAEHLNDISFHGRKDWKPAQVQALGWASAQKMVGIEPEDLAFALQRNTRSVDFELTRGPLHLGGDLDPKQAYAVARAMVPQIRQIIEDTPGVYFRDMSFGVSGWAEGQNASIHVDVLGSERDIQNMLSRFARAFDQEYVQASREISKDTARATLTIGSEAFADETLKVAFFKRLAELAPRIPVLDDTGKSVKEGGKVVRESELHGYMPGEFRLEDGSALPGIEIRTTKRSISPATMQKFTDRFKSAIEQVEQEMGIEVHYSAKNVELLIGSQHGKAGALSRIGGTGGLATLDDPLEAAARKRLIETVDAVRRGERPEPTDVRYLASGRNSELGVPHAEGATLDDIIDHMGAASRPHILSGKARYGQPPRVVDVHDPKDVPAWSQGHETISVASGARAIVPGSERPPQYLYRAISEEDWTQIKNNRFIKSDERMNLGPEGTVTSLDDPSFYLPGKLASDAPGTYEGRIIRIAYDDADGWTLGTDGYIKTQKAIPLDRVDMVSPKLVGERGTRLTAGGQEVPSLPNYKPVPYQGGNFRARFMGLDQYNRSTDPRAVRFDGIDERHFGELNDEELSSYADWVARYGDELNEVDEHPDIVNEYWGLAHEANEELARRDLNTYKDFQVTLMWTGPGKMSDEFVVKVRALDEDQAIEVARGKADPDGDVFKGLIGDGPEVDIELRGVRRAYLSTDPETVQFTVVRLPDDPKLSAAATARRQARSGKKRGVKGVRSITKPHQHHPIAVTEAVAEYHEERRFLGAGPLDPHPFPEDLSRWEGYGEKVELVSVQELARFREYDRRALGYGDEVDALKQEIIDDGGIREPLIIEYGANDKVAYLGEGNRRLQAAEELGYTHVPVRVMRRSTVSDRHPRIPVPGVEADRFGYVPGDMAPSTIGIPSTPWRTAREAATREYFAPGEQAHDLVRTDEGDALVHKLVDDHPELIKLLWELDPQDAILTQFPEMDTISLSTIERAKDMVRDLTWEHLRERYPDGVVTLYRGGRRAGGEEGLIPWTTNYQTALGTFAKGNPADVRVREVRIGEIEASVVAQQREVPGAWYKGFAGEDEMLLWGDDTSRFMAAQRRRGPGGRGHASSYTYIEPTNPATAEDLAMMRIAPRGRGRMPVAGVAATNMQGPQKGKTKVGISDRHGSAYALGHELFHYLETQLTPNEIKILKEGLGEPNSEDFVMGWTTWILMGGGGRMGPVFQKLSDSVIKDLAATGFSAENARAIPREVSELLTAMHEWTDLKGGAIRILDAEGKPTSITHTTGVAKEVFSPGMPLPLRRQLWDYLMFARAQKSAVRGRGPIGAMWSPAGLTKTMKGLLLKSGMFEADVIKGSMRDHFKALKLESVTRLRNDLIRYADDLPNGGRTPSSVTDYAIKINPDKTASPQLARYFDIIQGIDSGETIASSLSKHGGRFNLGELERVHEDAITAATRELFPGDVDGEAIEKVAARMMDEKRLAEEIGQPYNGEIENILWLPRELIESSHLFEPPSLQKARRSSYAPIIKGGVSLVDLGNDLFRTSLLLLNPAYYPMNLIGNLVMNVIQQGPWAVYNLPRAWRLSHSMGRDYVDFIDNLGGDGWFGVATIKSNMLAMRPSASLANVANMLVDRVPRRAAWLHEAMRMGYRSPEDLKRLIDGAWAGNADAAQDIELITRHMLEEMVDFNNLSPFERDFVTRLLFVYPWIKGSTVYTLRFPLNHPVQTAAFAYLYERQQSQANQEIGDRPQYLSLFFPFARAERFGEEYPYGMVLRQMFTFTTTLDIFNALYGYSRGDMTSSPLTEYLQPLYSAALTSFTGYDPFLDKKVERGLFSFFKQLGKDYTVDSPGWQNFSKAFLQSDEERQRHAEEGRLYPRNRMDDIMRFVFGSLAPGPVNPKTAGKRAREGQAQSPETKTVEWVEETEDTTGVKVPVKITAAKAAEYRYNEIQGDIRREEGTSDLTPWQLTEAKMRVYLEAHPEMQHRETAMIAGIRETPEEELDEWDDEFSRELGWDDLNEYERELREYEEPLVAPGAP